MKKIILLTCFLALLSAAASAQGGYRRYRSGPGLREGQLSYPEKAQLRRDILRYRVARRQAGRDGYITPGERIRMHQLKNKTRRDAIRFRHNGRRRLI